MNRICNSELDTWNAAQALAVGKPLDKMESVPEVAMEGFPSAESLHELGVSIGPNQVSHNHDQVTPFSKCNLGAAHAHSLGHTVQHASSSMHGMLVATTGCIGARSCSSSLHCFALLVQAFALG